MYPRWCSKQGEPKVWIGYKRVDLPPGRRQYTIRALSFASPYNPNWSPPVWKEVPRSFTVYGSKDCSLTEDWNELLHVSDSGFTGGDNGYGGDVRCWIIPFEKQDAFRCYGIMTHSNYGHRCNCVSLRKLKWFHSG